MVAVKIIVKKKTIEIMVKLQVRKNKSIDDVDGRNNEIWVLF